MIFVPTLFFANFLHKLFQFGGCKDENWPYKDHYNNITYKIL